MESKPVITYAGQVDIFEALQVGVCQGLPVESVEWRRSFGRAPKKVCVECNFREFAEDALPKDEDWKLLDQAFFHTYWTDCSDVDLYKADVRDDISRWLNVLRNHNIHDWLIICVEAMDSHRKAAKTKLLPRASVVDKVKSDFCGRSHDSQRCVSLLDPLKSDSRGAESWQSFLGRIRQLLMHAYNRHLSRFEEHMRSQRERRQEPEWSFCQYFLLQEELAFVFEMLGIYDEALVQYDELDALFTQFILNSIAGESPKWLEQFTKSYDSWRGLKLSTRVDRVVRDRISDGVASLLELRNYLFSRQCSLLLLLYRPWEVAQRTLPFLHNCINELCILEVGMPNGSISCWVFTSALEVLQTCERFNDSGQVENYSLYTASLWAYAKDKLHELGLLCGLMPQMSPTSEQLHTVVLLRTGMGDEDSSDNASEGRGPVYKLWEALSSKKSFEHHYVELSELAMSTFKHIKRMRSARLVGRDLADFYMKLGEPQKACTFLTNMLDNCINEGWDCLATQNRLDLVKCYQMSSHREKCIKMCALIASSETLDTSTRKAHFDLMFSTTKEIRNGSPLMMPATDVFVVDSVRLNAENDNIISETDIEIIVDLNSRFSEELKCEQLTLRVNYFETRDPVKSAGTKSSQRVQDGSNMTRRSSVKCSSPVPCFEEHINRSQEFVGLICSNSHTVLSRRDSQRGAHIKVDGKSRSHDEISELHGNLILENVTLLPGKNVLKFHCKDGKPGFHLVGQLVVKAGLLEFVLPQLGQSEVAYRVISESPKVSLVKATKSDLMAGAEQSLLLTVNTGSSHIEPDTVVRLQASKGLLLRIVDDEAPIFMQSIECTLPIAGPFQTVTCIVKVLADVIQQKDAGTFESKVFILSPWSIEKQAAQLSFIMPFLVKHNLHTTNTRKFIQIMVQGLQQEEFKLSKPNLEVSNLADVPVTPLNPLEEQLVVHKDQNACFVWELLVENIKQCPTLQLTFTMEYTAVADKWREHDDSSTQSNLPPLSVYKHEFVLINYKTLYTIHSEVEPIGGSKFCRMGNICHMNVAVTSTTKRPMADASGDAPDIEPHSSLMYEVLADQMSWAVCGRTAGVISMSECLEHNVTLDVMPLTRGFLPVPNVRLSKYLPAPKENSKKADATALTTVSSSLVGSNVAHCSRLEPFTQGQVYNRTKAIQVQVLPALGTNSNSEGGIQA